MVNVRTLIRQPLAIVLLTAFALRLAWVLLVPVVPQSDALMYDGFARAILGGHGYSYPDGHATAYWPVGASALYAIAYGIFGIGGLGIAVFNVVMGTIMAGAGYALACRRFGDRAGLIAGLLIACWPVWIELATIPNSELPCALLLMLALLVRAESPEADRAATPLRHWLPRSLLSAAFLAGSAYMRPIVMPLFVGLPILDWIRHRNAKRALGDVAAMLLVAAALIGPWAMRNKAVFGQAVPISTNFGANLWMGNNPYSDGGYMQLPEIPIDNEVARDKYFKTEALDFIKAHPGRYLELTWQRLFLSFDRETIGAGWNAGGLSDAAMMPLKLFSSFYWLAGLLFGLVGFFLLLRRNWLSLFEPVIVATGLILAIALLVVGGDRYHVPADPFIAIVAATAIARFLPGRKTAVR